MKIERDAEWALGEHTWFTFFLPALNSTAEGDEIYAKNDFDWSGVRRYFLAYSRT